VTPSDAALERSRFFDEAAAMTPLIAVSAPKRMEFLVSTRDTGVGRTLFTQRQRAEMATLRAALRIIRREGRARSGANQTFIDVGANIGTTTVPALLVHGFKRAVVLEPDPLNYKLLRLNAVLNGIDDQVTSFNIAASDDNGPALLDLAASNFGDHRLVLGPVKRRQSRGRAGMVKVERRTLDDLAASGAFEAEDIGLLWIDTQGHEGRVLSGAGSLLERGVPTVFELVPAAYRDRPDEAALLIDAVAGLDRRLIDLRATRAGRPAAARPASDLPAIIADQNGRRRITDLLLV